MLKDGEICTATKLIVNANNQATCKAFLCVWPTSPWLFIFAEEAVISSKCCPTENKYRYTENNQNCRSPDAIV